jgi:hypothetical protein
VRIILKAPNFTRLKNMFSGWKLTGLVLLLYVAFTVILTYPVAFTIGTNVPGWGDAFQWMNTLWYTNYAMFHPEITTLAYSNLIFYPTGIPIIPFTSAFNQIIALLLLPICQIQVIYSLLWLLTFILAAFGTYLLVRYLTQNNYAAFLAGIIFAYTPYHLVHAQGHMGATTIEWIPFCALFFMKVFHEGGIKNCILAGIFYILVAMSDLQYMIFMGIFIAGLFLYEHFVCLWKNKVVDIETHKSILIKYLIVGIIAFSIILPLTITDIQVAVSGNNFLKPDPQEAVTYSTDLLSFFLPSVLHPLFGGLITPVYHNFTGNISENTTYIGYTVLFLSLYAAWKLRKQILVIFWMVTALLFSLFSLGPILHVNGKTIFTVFYTATTIPLPYTILSRIIPFLDNSRTPGRFFVIAALAFAVLAGYGADKLLTSWSTQKNVLCVLLCGLIIFEFLSVPCLISPADQPAFYKNISTDNATFAILEIPATMNYTAGVKIIYYQTIHGKPIVGGQDARMPANARDFEENTPFIRDLTYLETPKNDIINQSVYSVGNSVLRYYNIRYVVLHKDSLTNEQLETAQTLITHCNPVLPKVYEDDRLIVYEQNRTEPVSSFISLESGWQGLENWSGISSRWMSSNASILVFSDYARDTWLNFTAISFAKERPVSIIVNNETIGSYRISSNFGPISIPVRINKGINSFEISSSDGCERPVDNATYSNMDTRCLSIALQNLSIS